MISRGKLAFLVFVLLVFAASAWAGYTLHGKYVSVRQLAQPGWCCMPQHRECVATASSADCRAGGGSTFNWNQSACISICSAGPTQHIKRQ